MGFIVFASAKRDQEFAPPPRVNRGDCQPGDSGGAGLCAINARRTALDRGK